MLFYKRSPDDEQKRQAFSLLESIGVAMHKHLTEYRQCKYSLFPLLIMFLIKSDDGKTSDSYHTLMLGLVTVMLFDGEYMRCTLVPQLN